MFTYNLGTKNQGENKIYIYTEIFIWNGYYDRLHCIIENAHVCVCICMHMYVCMNVYIYTDILCCYYNIFYTHVQEVLLKQKPYFGQFLNSYIDKST